MSADMRKLGMNLLFHKLYYSFIYIMVRDITFGIPVEILYTLSNISINLALSINLSPEKFPILISPIPGYRYFSGNFT